MQKLPLILFVFIYSFSNAFALDFFEDEDVFWKQGRNKYFKYSEQDSSLTGKNDHPVELKKDDIRYALESLEIWDKDLLESNEALPTVLSIKQTALLAEHLKKGLAKAKPDQDILFALDRRRERLFGLKTDIFYIAGRAFYKDGKLNIIIGDYDRPRLEGYEQAYDPTHVGIVAYNFFHGSRKSKQKFDEPTVKVVGIENKEIKNKLRKDWFVIDVEQAAENYLAAQQKEENPTTGRDKQFEIEAAKLAKERREMKLEMARLRKEMKQGGIDVNRTSSVPVEQRLENLDQLYNKGLVTEEEYKSKRKEILKDI